MAFNLQVLDPIGPQGSRRCQTSRTGTHHQNAHGAIVVSALRGVKDHVP